MNDDTTTNDGQDRATDQAETDDYTGSEWGDLPTDRLDYLCWYVAATYANFSPPDESAEQALDGMDADPEKAAWEHGYHAGAETVMQDTAEFLDEILGIDIIGRAKVYALSNDLDQMGRFDALEIRGKEPRTGSDE